MYAFRLDSIPAIKKIIAGIQKTINDSVNKNDDPAKKMVVIRVVDISEYNHIPKLEFKNLDSKDQYDKSDYL